MMTTQTQAAKQCCCSCSSRAETKPDAIEQLTPDWSAADYWGMLRVRFGFGRMSYGVSPGLYRIGDPTPDSPVLVTANFKLTVDVLRRELGGENVWLLILDTDNVNVWCAAGKGTFGTKELVERVAATALADRINHRRLILPQLGAPGVAAHEVKKKTGFTVVYGPVRAADIPAFLAADQVATAEMRRVRFSLLDRVALIPVEMRRYWLPTLVVALLAGLLRTPWNDGWQSLIAGAWPGAATAAIGWLGGCLVGPVLLPWLPGRAFWLKGAFLGVLLGLPLALSGALGGWIPAVSSVLWLAAGVSFLLMNFTGCSTYTSQSGVKAEMKMVPWQAAIGVIGLVVWIGNGWLA